MLCDARCHPVCSLPHDLLDCIITAEQGVVNISFSINTQGNLVQDVAAMLTGRKMVREYLDMLGYRDTEVTMNCSNWSGQFPQDVFSASAVISMGVFAAVASKSEIATVKTIEEAKSIPKREANVASIRLAKTLITLLQDQVLQIDGKAVEAESRMLEAETRLLSTRILDMGNGDVVIGEIKAIESGCLDDPFLAVSESVHCRVIGAGTGNGAIRYLDHGNLPLTAEIIVEFHKEKVAERERIAGKKARLSDDSRRPVVDKQGTLLGS